MIHPTVSEDVNRKLPARNMTVQFLTIYTDPESTMHSVTDGQTDYDANSRCYCAAVRESAKICFKV